MINNAKHRFAFDLDAFRAHDPVGAQTIIRYRF